MAYDRVLAQRIRDATAGEPGLSEKAMFGGLAFLVRGNMAVAASGQGGVLLRIDPADAESLTSQPHVERFEMRGRAMNGWLAVHPEALQTDAELQAFVDVGLSYARSLPAK
ncbi:TfoX/Sxy family protein [Angustibacter sp. McL0619]|uniref:TfoX/Sxy family protein n=1 Tax=Angustibacter sp. McL0619 TaxID=3415676 RepID=UPI003CFA92E7